MQVMLEHLQAMIGDANGDFGNGSIQQEAILV